jgi:phospholipase/lecithinase/hemolysin
MKVILRFLALLAMLIGSVASPQTTYPALYEFGDSLTDSGNAYLGTGGLQASPSNGYFLGRFSNGLNFADYLSVALTGSPTVPALAGGLNFSVGGADAQFKPGAVSPSFLEQIGLYNSLVGRPISSDALVLVTFGGNDVRDTILTGGTIDFSAAGNDLATGLGLLYNLGARNFVITDSPDIGLLPVSVAAAGSIPGRLNELTQRSLDINALFATRADQLDALPGTNVDFFDLFGFEHALLDNPAAFGLPPTLNTTTPCQIPGGGSPQIANCADSLYFDAIHPTTQVHAVIAGGILTQLSSIAAVPEPSTWAMMLVGFAAIGIITGRERRRATAPVRQDIGGIHPNRLT